MYKKYRRCNMNNGIYTVINEGIALMKNPYLDDKLFLVWLDYSRKMLDLVCQDPFVKYQYASFLMPIISSQEKTIDKLNKCIDCLMKLAPLI